MACVKEKKKILWGRSVSNGLNIVISLEIYPTSGYAICCSQDEHRDSDQRSTFSFVRPLLKVTLKKVFFFFLKQCFKLNLIWNFHFPFFLPYLLPSFPSFSLSPFLFHTGVTAYFWFYSWNYFNLGLLPTKQTRNSTF